MKYKSNTIKMSIFLPICVVLFFVAVFLKTAYIALNDVVEGTNVKELAANRTKVTKTLKASRGNILDNQGNLLAQNVNSYTVIAYLSKSRTTDERYPKHVVDKETTARKLAEILEPINSVMTYEYIWKLLNTENVYQVELGPGGRNITELVKNKIEELSLPGIDFVKTSKRYYQNGDFASYIVGYAKKYETEDGKSEYVGELGIEGFTDRYLKGKDGSITYDADAYGYQLPTTVTYETPSEDGYDIYLTLDKQVQIFLDAAVEGFEKYINTEEGTDDWVQITVADAHTGAIIGSSTYPSFDPNKLNITNYNNPLTSYQYEPGSTMKIFSFMSAIEEGKYKGDELYQSGTITVDDYTIKDWNKWGWGKITYDVGFTYSSNTAAVRLAQQVGKADLINYYKRLGFGTKTGIELSNEYDGKLSINYNTELASASYGQGVTVTPIQMIQALTAITNDGTVLKPYIIDKIVDPNKGTVVYQGGRTEVEKVYSTYTVNKIIELMDNTVNNIEDKTITGKAYHTDAVRVIGKTGTADYTDKNGKYIADSVHVIRSFAGVFPKDNPEYIIYVAVKDFTGTTSQMGAIVKNLIESVAKYRNIDTRETDKDESKIVTVPNLVNKTVTSASADLSNLGIQYVIIGDGNKIVSQYPKKGNKVSQKSKVFLKTNSSNIPMPDVTGWSSAEIVDFCNIVGLKYNLDGYGYVSTSSIPAGTILDGESVLTVTLQSITPQSLINEEVKEDGKQEGN